MTWQYNVADILTSTRDQVRFQIGDTNPQNQLIQDEEIALALRQRSDIFGACANICLALATRFSLQPDSGAGDTKMAYSQVAKAYRLQALYFNTMSAQNGSAMPYVGGISIADVQNNEFDTDRVVPEFSREQFDSDLPIGQSVPVGPGLGEDSENVEG